MNLSEDDVLASNPKLQALVNDMGDELPGEGDEDMGLGEPEDTVLDMLVNNPLLMNIKSNAELSEAEEESKPPVIEKERREERKFKSRSVVETSGEEDIPAEDHRNKSKGKRVAEEETEDPPPPRRRQKFLGHTTNGVRTGSGRKVKNKITAHQGAAALVDPALNEATSAAATNEGGKVLVNVEALRISDPRDDEETLVTASLLRIQGSVDEELGKLALALKSHRRELTALRYQYQMILGGIHVVTKVVQRLEWEASEMHSGNYPPFRGREYVEDKGGEAH